MSGKDIPAALRRAVLARDNWECQFVKNGSKCRAPAKHVDHILPRRYGGQTEENNLRAACVECNTKAGAIVGHTIKAAERHGLREW